MVVRGGGGRGDCMQRGTCNKDEHRPPFMLGLVRFSSGVNIRSVRTFPSRLARSSAPFGLESRTWVSNDFPSFLSQFLLISISLFSVNFSILLSGLTFIPIKAKIRKTCHPCIFPPCRTTRIVTMTPKKKKTEEKMHMDHLTKIKDNVPHRTSLQRHGEQRSYSLFTL